jgi:8-oxo-dGTP pyrophosphatase MutT (NUDIX family)
MYKVFIENNPIHFITKAEKKDLGAACVYLTCKKSVVLGIEMMLKKITNDEKLCVVCNDLEVDFKAFFSHFDFVDAAGGIVQRKQKYLFIKRNGRWDIPKGKLEKGELASEGAVREIEEECGISKPVIDYLICETYHTYTYKSRPTIKKTVWFKMSYEGTKEVFPQLEEGITKVKWFKKMKFYKVLRNTYPSIIEVLDEFEKKSS